MFIVLPVHLSEFLIPIKLNKICREKELRKSESGGIFVAVIRTKKDKQRTLKMEIVSSNGRDKCQIDFY